MRRSPTARNREDMTFSEWYRAATHFGAKIPRELAVKAWTAGEDPTEWANYEPGKRHGNMRGVIGPGGLRAASKFTVHEGRIYGLGASSSPKLVYITSATSDRIKYKPYPFHGKDVQEVIIERWIAEDLIARGTKTLYDMMKRGRLYDAEIAASIEAAMTGKEARPVNIRGYERVTVNVVATKGRPPRGVSRENDPWYWAEEYGGVGAREENGEYVYQITTNRRGLEELQNDKRFRVIDVEE